jgi:Mg-chelatase subunit ChlD
MSEAKSLPLAAVLRPLVLAAIVPLSGCNALLGLLGLDDLALVGVMPAAGYADPDSADYGKFFVAIGGENKKGEFVAPIANLLEVRDESGEALVIGQSQEKEGTEQGSMFLLVDESASLNDTDPDEHRKEAVAQLARKLGKCAAGWRMSLNGFDGYQVREIVPWTDDLTTIEAAAEDLTANGATNLYDAVIESVPAVRADVSSSFNGGAEVGQALVVISDGADTASYSSRDEMTSAAASNGTPVHTVGLGPASDHDSSMDPNLVGILREVSDVSGGVYGAASDAADLPRIAEAIAQAHCGGYTVLVVEDDSPSESGSLVDGEVGVVETDVSVPFTFVAP